MLRFVLKSLRLSLLSNTVLHVASVLTVTLCVGLIVFSFTAARALRQWTARLDDNIRVLVQVQAKDVAAVQREIERIEGVAAVEKLTDEAIADSVSRVLGIQAPAALRSLGLPAIYKVQPTDGSSTRLLEIADQIGRIRGVVSVEYGQRWLSRFKEFSRTVLRASVGLALLLMGTALMILVTTFTLVLYSRKRELEIMVLVGASPAHIYVPAMAEGLLQSITGSVLAVVLTETMWSLAADKLVIFGSAFEVELGWSMRLLYVLLGVMVGGLASLLAMMQALDNANSED